MKITAGAAWQTPNGERKFDLELTDEDGMELLMERSPDEDTAMDEWGDMPPTQRFRFLKREAEKMVVVHVAQQGALTAEQAQRRIAELNTQ